MGSSDTASRAGDDSDAPVEAVAWAQAGSVMVRSPGDGKRG